ncbi:MAG TPA: tetratricopeptide repeat protein [Pyrinomonadaceae bacterium]|nr:tetratricopeptide repeat protein [Pyrinomonadaceae bacterium]
MKNQTRNQTGQEARVAAAERLVTGQTTLAEFTGLRREQLYEIARTGYRMMNSGKLEEARRIYRGLVAADPFDSVFHCHLGAVHLRLSETDAALREFDAALRFNCASTDALAGRGETYLNRGQIAEAVKDLRAAVESDPASKRPSTLRARAILLALKEAARTEAVATTRHDRAIE